ncbi:MAG: hypothetical protein KatS3mg068_1038 [Candidatus Sericytochromatia bacterium]|nr:MAG: hypothetical protein KatS3mg068_1038 [Candidatus Sericytochromatia bacterium]
MGHLSNYKTLKKYNPDLIIAVAGCVPQHEKENIRKKAPWVNIVFGSQNFNKIHEMVKNFEENRKSIVSIVKQTDVYEEDIPVIRDNKYTAWVTVMNGCSRYCTFCIVSYVTTNYSPRPGTLVAEMEDQIPEEEKYKMSNYLNKIVQKIAKEKNCQEIGKIRTVLVKGFNKEKGGKFYGRTRRNKLVHFECDESMLGKIVDIKITDATVASLRGEVMKLAKV